MTEQVGYTHAEAFDSGDLQVSDLHRVHYAQYGNPQGKPVIFLHGGPGGNGCTPKNATFFSPTVYRAVLLDQRGAGRSTPSTETRDNTTQLLVQDVETLRAHLGIRKWHVVFGGSWGSTLALAYAQAHPEVTGSLVLRGVFLGSREEVACVNDGSLAGMLYPDEYDRFVGYLAPEQRGDPLSAYHALIHGADADAALEAAREWNRWETSISTLERPSEAQFEAEAADADADRWNMAHAKMETHYFVNGCFLGEKQLLEGCEKIRDIPTRIVQGRYDIVCPPRAAVAVHKRLANSQLQLNSYAGHSAFQPDTLKKLVEYCDELGKMDL